MDCNTASATAPQATGDIKLLAGWIGPNRLPYNQAYISEVDLKFKDSANKIKVLIPFYSDPDQLEPLLFHMTKYEKVSHPKSLCVSTEKLRDLSLTVHLFKSGEKEDSEYENSPTLQLPEKFEIGQEYRLILSSKALIVSATLIKEADRLAETIAPASSVTVPTTPNLESIREKITICVKKWLGPLMIIAVNMIESEIRSLPLSKARALDKLYEEQPKFDFIFQNVESQLDGRNELIIDGRNELIIFHLNNLAQNEEKVNLFKQLVSGAIKNTVSLIDPQKLLKVLPLIQDPSLEKQIALFFMQAIEPDGLANMLKEIIVSVFPQPPLSQVAYAEQLLKRFQGDLEKHIKSNNAAPVDIKFLMI